ncbi:stage II sporulation protein M [Paenibacillus nasutitermitis]|uniref:Stage II sporulation protein M n=1 Tax=Paenibacillus nasutitermitis TaxID=1652958 RepID=A0A917DV03_9BACL|nr:stage II sporulation protein M [Paenibacillus nasutitermitis]GGD69869.1 stage II sporulation protein M [Paenibacillus nasutitermitis]
MRSSTLQPMIKDKLVLYVFVCVLFVVGLVFGALLVNALTLDQQQDLAGDVQQFAQHIQSGMLPDAAQSFWDRAIFNAKWILLIWVLGLTVVGMPLVLALDFLKGVLVGFAVGTLVSQHEWKGLLFSLVSVAPANLFVVPALLIASVSAVSFSIYVIKNRLLGRYGSMSQSFISHTATGVFMILIAVGAALVESFVSPLLLKWAAPLILGIGTGL